MENYILKTELGRDAWSTFDNALALSRRLKRVVEFEFNDIACLVDKDSVKANYARDYLNSFLVNWKRIGPNYLDEYPTDIQECIAIATKELEDRRAESLRKRKEEEDVEKSKFNSITNGVDIEFRNKSSWEEFKENNKDSYGAGILEFAESWAKLMQVEISKGKSLDSCAKETSFQLGFLGITGYMYGAAVSVLSLCWKYGEELRVWHNKEYNHNGDGVVNPAILTIAS